jgi:membrane dipeptidase
MVGVIDANSSDVAIARTVREAEKINAEDRMAIFLHLTGAWCAGDIAVLRTYYRLGVRAIHICVEGLSGVGDASDEYAELGGLSDFGRQLVHEMNQLGMVVDVAHASDQVVEEISKISTAPIISSHTSCRKFCNIKRALPDYLIKKIADTGGVVGLIFASSMLQQIVEKEVDHKYKEIWQAKQDALQSMYPNPYEFLSHYMTYETAQEVSDTAGVSMEVPIRVDIDALVDSIDYIVKLTSVDHVSIGPDYDIGCAPKGLEKADTLSNLTKALLRRGYSESDIHKIWGGNLKRVYRSVIGE